MILIFMVEGAKAVISFCIRSAIPGYMVVPPEDRVGVKILTKINVGLHDGVEAAFVDADDLHAEESGAEHGLGAAETLVANGDNLSVGQLVGFLNGGGGGGGGHLLLEVESDVAKLLLDVTDNF